LLALVQLLVQRQRLLLARRRRLQLQRRAEVLQQGLASASVVCVWRQRRHPIFGYELLAAGGDVLARHRIHLCAGLPFDK
jgi:hypothetical protein